MSGEAGGLILIPLALAAMPLVLGGLAIAGAVSVGVKAGGAAVRYEQEQRQRREEIRRSGVAQSIGDFRGTMLNSMNEQTSLNIQASERTMLELESQRTAMRRAAEQQDTQAFQSYVSNLKAARAQTMQAIANLINTFCDSRKVYCVPTAINKGTAVTKFKKQFETGVTVGVGDSMNDLSMLESVDIPIIPHSMACYVSNPNRIVVAKSEVLSDAACDEISKLIKSDTGSC